MIFSVRVQVADFIFGEWFIEAEKQASAIGTVLYDARHRYGYDRAYVGPTGVIHTNHPSGRMFVIRPAENSFIGAAWYAQAPRNKAWMDQVTADQG